MRTTYPSRATVADISLAADVYDQALARLDFPAASQAASLVADLLASRGDYTEAVAMWRGRAASVGRSFAPDVRCHSCSRVVSAAEALAGPCACGRSWT